MNKSACLAVVGGDVRQAYLAALLRADGHRVRTFALDRHPIAGCAAITDLSDALHGVQAVLLPIPIQLGDGRLNAPLAAGEYALTTVLDAIEDNVLALGGAIPFSAHAHAVQNGLRLIDYLSRDELAIRNAVPTCEGALQLAMEQTDFTLQDSRCLVIGYGKIGKLLSQKLAALGAEVSVSARSAEDFARIEAAGHLALDTRALTEFLSVFDIIFNTVPAPVLGRAELAALVPPTLLIDLASLPGGIVPDAVAPEGCRILHALSLPGKVAPLSAARALHRTALTLLHEEGIV